MQQSYIYKISFDNTDKVYIGHSLNPEARFRRHLQKLRDGIHHSKKWQQDYPNICNPVLNILEQCDSVYAITREKYWITKYNSYVSGYNATPGGESLGTGEDCPASRHSLDDYMAVLAFLAHTDMTTREIASELGVGLGIVLNISSQTNHLYLKDLMPEEWALMCRKVRHHPNWRTYPKVLSPDGEIHEVTNARAFSKQHGLDQSDFNKLLNGKKPKCKGWTLAKEVQPC